MPTDSFLFFSFIMNNFTLLHLTSGGSSPLFSSLLIGSAISTPFLPSLLAQPAPDSPFTHWSISLLAEQLLMLASEIAASSPDTYGALFVMFRPLFLLPPAPKGVAAVQLTL
jgi:hypothetical protein